MSDKAEFFRLNVVREPPVQCGFAAGDTVEFTNDYGAKFVLKVKGFSRESENEEPLSSPDARFVYVFDDAFWFPVAPSTLKVVREA